MDGSEPTFVVDIPGEAPLSPPASDRMAWVVFLMLYGLALAGALVMLTKTSQVFLALAMIGPLTLIGIIWKPLFGVCLLSALAPMGRALALVPGAFTVERGLGLLLFLAVVVNLIVTGRRPNVRHPAVYVLSALTVLSIASTAWASNLDLAIHYSGTMFQLMIYSMLVVAVCQDWRSVLWPLRVFTVSALVTVVFTTLFGLAPGRAADTRLTLAVEEAVFDANAFASVLALGFLTAVYLNRRDPVRMLRPLWLAAMVVLPVAALMAGSRGVSIALAVTVALPLVMLVQATKSPLTFLGNVMLALLLVVVVAIGAEYIVSAKTLTRLTDIEMARQSSEQRLYFVRAAIDYTVRHPLGAGIACFAVYTGHVVHNDFFYVLSNLGFLGTIIVTVFVLAELRLVRRIPPGWEKWYVRAVLTFLLVVGLSLTQVFYKHFWLFMTLSALVGMRFLSKTAHPIPTCAQMESALHEYPGNDQFVPVSQRG